MSYQAVYRWTIPLGTDTGGKIKLGYLELPERNLTGAEWQRLMVVLEMFKPGLVIEVEPAPQGDIVDTDFVEVT